MTIQEIKQNTEQTAEGMDRLAVILQREVGLQGVCIRLRHRATKLRENRFSIVIVGEFKRGKSTVLNALLGRPVLPQKAAPCTAIITQITYGEPPQVRVLFADGTPDERLTPEEFKAKYELKVTDTNDVPEDTEAFERYEQQMEKVFRDRFGHIDHAEIAYPIELCHNGVELVD
jgi:septin family protein